MPRSLGLPASGEHAGTRGAPASPGAREIAGRGPASRECAAEAARPVALQIVHDHPIIREGLRLLLASMPGIRVIGEARAGEDVLLASPGVPDVVLIDVDLEGDEVVAALPRIALAARTSKVLALTASHDPLRHGAALHAGARGIVTKDSPVELILKAIRKVSAGEAWFERHVLDTALRARQLDRATGPGHEELTLREREVVALIGEGLKNCEIASRLSISKKTVRNHLSSIFGKLEVSDRLELLVHAHQLGLVSIARRPVA